MSEENKINSVTSSVDTGTSIKFIGESDSTGNNLRIEDGKLSGTIVGSVIKDYTGRVDDVTLELSNVPIDGVGGGSGGSSLEWVKVIAEARGAATIVNGTNTNEAVIRYACGGNFVDGKTLYDLIQDREIIAVRGVLPKTSKGTLFASYSGCLQLDAKTPEDAYAIPVDAAVAGIDIRRDETGASAYFLFPDDAYGTLTDGTAIEVWVLVA